MTKKIRLDLLLVERDLIETRARAQARIMAGHVFVNGERCDKAGTKLPMDAQVEVRGEPMPYVSRGGSKLEAALDAFSFDCTDQVVIDVGASTGGFTDCVLQRGAARVYAIDVGYGQLAWKLRQDPRVINIERTNIRHADRALVPEPCTLAVIDCSFISLEKILPPTLPFLSPEAHVISLIKPQFEVGQEHIAKGGVVKDQRARQAAIAHIIAQAEALGLRFVRGIDCPVHGPAGNIEYLAMFARDPNAPQAGTPQQDADESEPNPET